MRMITDFSTLVGFNLDMAEEFIRPFIHFANAQVEGYLHFRNRDNGRNSGGG